MFEAKINLAKRSATTLLRKAEAIGGKNKNFVFLMALAGILEHASAAQKTTSQTTDSDKSQVGTDETTIQPIDVAIEDPEAQQALEAALAEIAQTDPAIQALIDGQINFVLLDPTTGKPSLADDAEVYTIGLDGKVVRYEGTHSYALTEQGEAILLAQAETGVVSDAAAGSATTTATTSAATAGAAGAASPMLIALGALGLAAATSGNTSTTPAAPVNHAPTAVALSASTVAENAAGAAIGTLTVTDPDAGNTHILTVDDARFEVVAGQLKLKDGISLDFEAASTVNVNVTATDAGGLFKTQAFAINVTDVFEAPPNSAPTAVALSASTVAENAAGAVIGNLTVTDPDAGNTHTLTVDDTRFEVVGGQLKLKDGISLDHEAATSVNVTVTATDAGGLSKAQAFAITVTDVAETTTIVGTADANTISFPAGLDDFIITGLAGNDSITTGVGNDIIRPGEGADTVSAGTGNDIVVVVGQTAAGQYAQSDVTNPGGSGIDLSSVITLADLNGRALSEVAAGENIDGGTGTNRLVIYGNVDLTGVTLTNITQFQVNSTVTISAQQLTALGLNVIFGDGESVLNITNSGADPVTLDLSGMTFSNFRTLNVSAGVTVVLDQADVDSLQNLSGEGTLKASTATGTLNLVSKYVTLAIQDKDGTDDATHGGGTFVAGKLLIGGEADDTLTGGATADRIEGGAGDDTLVGGDGNDVLRGGAGVDSMDGGAGDDTFVVVGDISGGGKVDSVADTAALGFPLTNLNGKNLNEDEGGSAEVIRGGDGGDTLYVYGTADLSKYDITGIEHIEIRSDVTFTYGQISGFKSVIGDGNSVLRINDATTPIVVDLTQLAATTGLSLSKLGQISVGNNVTLKISSVNELGGATILTGSGTIKSDAGPLTLTSAYSVQDTLKFSSNVNVAQTEKLAQVVAKISGELIDDVGNDYLPGTDYADVFKMIHGGDDVASGKKGSDIFKIAGTGKKIILDVAIEDNGVDRDVLDFSLATGPASIDISLVNAGTVGNATIQLGSGTGAGGTQQAAPKFNLMLIVDISGSMTRNEEGEWGVPPTRMDQAKQAANQLIDAYKNVGDVAVRIVTFGRGWNGEAGSDFDGKDEWMSIVDAKSVIDSLAPDGSTPYAAALDAAERAFLSQQGQLFYKNGNNVSFFLSDGVPDASIYAREDGWEDFLIANRITSNALGFGGLNNTYELEPVAFNGTKVKSPSDDHAFGEIPAQVTVSLEGLGEELIAQAKLDFIEDIKGTDYIDPLTGKGDTLTGNGLDNRIEGGAGNDLLTGLGGNDTLVGGAGDHDIAVFQGNFADYDFSLERTGVLRVAHERGSKADGVDYLIDVEAMRFADTAVGSDIQTSTYLNATLRSAADIFKNYDSTGSVSDNYFKFFFDLSKASYFHTATHKNMGAATSITTETSQVALSTNDIRSEGEAYSYLYSGTLGYKSFKDFDTGLTTSRYVNSGGQNLDYNYLIEDGWFISADKKKFGLDIRSSVAKLGISEDGKSLFVTFRGTDFDFASGWVGDWVDDLFDMYGHYDRYKPLFSLIDSYINENKNGVEHIYVSGHSLGGQMATWFMQDHIGDSRFNAVLFEPANKARLDSPSVFSKFSNAAFDTRIVSFEAENDPVPDLGGGTNPGNTIHLNVDGYPLTAGLHAMSALQLPFLKSLPWLDKDHIANSARIYSQYGDKLSTDGGLAKTGLDFLISVATGLVAIPVSKAEFLSNARGNGFVTLGAIADFSIEVTWLVLNKIKDAPLKFVAAYLSGSDGFSSYLTTLITKEEIGIAANEVIEKYGQSININLIGELGPLWKAAIGYFTEAYGEMLETGYEFKVASSGLLQSDAGGRVSESSSSDAAKLTIEQIPFYSLVSHTPPVYTHTQPDITEVTIKPFLLGAEKLDDILSEYRKAYPSATLTDKVAHVGLALVQGGVHLASIVDTASGKVLDQNIEIDASSWKPATPGDNLIVHGNYASNKIIGSNSDDVLNGRWGNDLLIGGGGSDLLLGAGDKDVLYGGEGNDILISDSISGTNTNIKSIIGDVLYNSLLTDETGWVANFDSKGSGVLYGGKGNDTLIGNHAADYYLVDVALTDNANNKDDIFNLDVGGLGSFHKDYVVFSRSQLGLTPTTGGNEKVFGVGGFSTLNGDQFAIIENGQYNKDSISSFLNSKDDSAPFFSLWLDSEKKSGTLYFDADGYHDGGDLVALAKIDTISTYSRGLGLDLTNFGVDQLLLVNDFPDASKFALDLV